MALNFEECIEVLGLSYRAIDLPEDKYGLKCPYEMDAEYLTIHNTSNVSPAINEISYMQENDYETSFHFAVDEDEVIRGLPWERNAWHAGDGSGAGNMTSLSIEICRSTNDDYDLYMQCEENGAKFAAVVLYDKDWSIADHLRKHQDWSGKWCPHRILDENRWDDFCDKVQHYLHILQNAANPPEPDYEPEQEEDDVDRYYDYGKNPFYDNREDFIEKVANAALDVCENYGRTKATVPAVVAQAILESGAGTTGKAALYNNYFGMKDRGARVTCNDGTFESRSQEQNEDGSYEDIVCYWYSFPGLDQGVEGYYQFTNIENYDNLKGVYDCEEYLNNLKADSYATSHTYVENCMRIIEENNLMRFAPNGWYHRMWFDNGVMARNKEFYDPSTNAWYWADADGSIARDKDVYIPNGDKWVRYNQSGQMVKGWDDVARGVYFFDYTTGAMAKGFVEIEDNTYHFDEHTGIMSTNWECYREEYDAWFYFENDGTMARDKDVYLANGDKWVRYDGIGRMVKGWNVKPNGVYYFDTITGAMAKGHVVVEDKKCFFDETTGVGYNGWYGDFWYENGVRQGTEGRGKEIYDPSSDAWYWLDSIQDGAMARNKDVYIESQADYEGHIGKWVRYNAFGHMVKGWDTNANGTYYFDPVYGTMAKGERYIDGALYYFDEVTGILR